MTVQEATHAKQPFQVWARLGETFAVLGRRPFLFLGFSIAVGILLPYAIGFAIAYLLQTAGVGGASGGLATVLSIVFVIIAILSQLLLYAGLTLGACDALVGTRRSVRAYLETALRRMVPLALVLIPVGIAIALGYLMIGILGLWATAVYSAVLPIVVVEQLGWRAMGRARALSKEYRWPIVGYLLILGIILFAVFLAIIAALGAMGENTAIVLAPLLIVLFTPLSAVVTCVASAIVYTRLRTIKEGGAVAELADVFA